VRISSTSNNISNILSGTPLNAPRLSTNTEQRPQQQQQQQEDRLIVNHNEFSGNGLGASMMLEEEEEEGGVGVASAIEASIRDILNADEHTHKDMSDLEQALAQSYLSFSST
jgi:hypothetical protein